MPQKRDAMGWALLQAGKGSLGYRAEASPRPPPTLTTIRGCGTLYFETEKLLDKRKFRATWLIHLRANEAG